ncbi:MAG: molybdenum ABC transporter ATP-binding protein [Planctomycetes bacterium]|nr:molybdenum ABC transporter ATP-binding protein [Planctomycetota bacterium]
MLEPSTQTPLSFQGRGQGEGLTLRQLHVSCGYRYSEGFHLALDFMASSGITALFGPSGCGKTTTLELIAGLRQPAEGSIGVGDHALFDSSLRINFPPERRDVGYVSQDDLLFPHLTVRENLQFGMRRTNSPRLELEEVASMLELSELLERRPTTLSGGQRQRVALGRAVLSGPEILLMDEPVSAIDERLKHGLLIALQDIVSRLGIVAIFVSHDQVDVRQFAEHVVLLDNGRVAAAGPTIATLDEAFRLGTSSVASPTNVVSVSEARAADGVLHAKLGVNLAVLPSTSVSARADHVTIAFRPSDVMLSRHEVEGLSVRNSWRGAVTQIVAAADRIFVQINVGEMIWAEITNEALHVLNLRVGDQVVCLIKTSAIQVIA